MAQLGQGINTTNNGSGNLDDLRAIYRNSANPKSSSEPSSLGNFANDIGVGFHQGLSSLGTAASEAGNLVGLVSDKQAAQNAAGSQRRQEEIAQGYSKDHQDNSFINSEGGLNTDYSFRNAAVDLARSTPAIIGTIGSSAAAAAVAPEAAVGVTAAKLIPRAVAALSEGFIEGSNAASNVRNQVATTEYGTLLKQPKFVEVLKQQDNNLSGPQRLENARLQYADIAANDVGQSVTASTAGVAALTGGFESDLATRALNRGGLASKALGEAASKTPLYKNLAKEAFEELTQSGSSRYFQNVAEKDYINPNKDVTDGVVAEAAQGAVLGGATGGGFHFIGKFGVSANPNTNRNAKGQPVNPGTGHVNPINNAPVVNRTAGKAFDAYVNQYISRTRDVASQDYQQAHQDSINTLNSIIADPKSQPTDITEAKSLLQAVDNNHKAATAAQTAATQGNQPEPVTSAEQAAPIVQPAPAAQPSTQPEANKPEEVQAEDKLAHITGKAKSINTSSQASIKHSFNAISALSKDDANQIPDSSHLNDKRVYAKYRLAAKKSNGTPEELVQAYKDSVSKVEAEDAAKASKPTSTKAEEAPVAPEVPTTPEVQQPQEIQNVQPTSIPEQAQLEEAQVQTQEQPQEVTSNEAIQNVSQEVPNVQQAPVEESQPSSLPEVQQEASNPTEQTSSTPDSFESAKGIPLHSAQIELARFEKRVSGGFSKRLLANKTIRKGVVDGLVKGELTPENIEEHLKNTPEGISLFESQKQKAQTLPNDATVEEVKPAPKKAKTTKQKAVKAKSDVVVSEIVQEASEGKVTPKPFSLPTEVITETIEPSIAPVTPNVTSDEVSLDLPPSAENNPLNLLEEEGITAVQIAEQQYQEAEDKARSKIHNSVQEEINSLVQERDDLKIILEDDLDPDYEEAKTRVAEINKRIAELKPDTANKLKNSYKKQLKARSTQARKEALEEISARAKESGEISLDLGEEEDESLNPGNNVPTLQRTPEDRKLNESVVNWFKGKILTKVASNLIDIQYLEDFNQKADNILRNNPMNYSYSEDMRNALAITKTINGKITVQINGSKFGKENTRDLIGTLAHEVFGHSGMELLLGDKGYKDLRWNMIHTKNQELLKGIFGRETTWNMYLNNWNLKNPGVTLNSSNSIEYNGRRLPKEVMLKLADEHIAEAMRENLNIEYYKNTGVQLGITKPDTSSLENRSIVKKVVEAFKRIMNNILHTSFSTMFSDLEVKVMSYNAMNKYSTDTVIREVEEVSFMAASPQTTPSPVVTENTIQNIQQAIPSLESFLPSGPATSRLVSDLNGFVQAYNSSIGEVNQNSTINFSRFSNSFNRVVEKNSFLSSFRALGGIKSQKLYRALTLLSDKATSQEAEFAVKIGKALKGINAHQNAAVKDYFSTPNADPNSMMVDDNLKNLLIQAKAKINENSDKLYLSGALSAESYLKNKDMYLHTSYMAYMDAARGWKRKPSMFSYLKSKKVQRAEKELMLGKIHDVSFLIPETLGVVSRDLVLHDLFSALNQSSVQGDLNWVLQTDEKISDPRDKRFKLTRQEALTRYGTNVEILDKIDKGEHKVFGTQNLTLDQIDKLRKSTTELKALIDDLEQRTLDSAIEQATGKTNLTPQEKTDFINKFYTKLPEGRQFGELAGAYVRKEIANDLKVFNSAFDLKNPGFVNKLLAPGGTLDRATHNWKLIQVGLNPQSWTRNFLGNFSLLTMHTNTSSLVLGGHLINEFYSASKGNPSEFWRMGQEYGFFGATQAHAEFNSYFKDKGDALRAEYNKAIGIKTNSMDEHLHVANPATGFFLNLAKNLKDGATWIMAHMEGLYKVVSMKDYIRRWESENGISHRSLPEEQKRVLYTKAADHANTAIFDYTRVNQTINFLRGTSHPFGIPFITFQYKAAGATGYAMAHHPMKLASMLATPVLLGLLGSLMGDVDDKERETAERSLPRYKRNSFGTFIWPWKDRNGHVMTMDIGYLLPFAQYLTAANILKNGFKSDTTSLGTDVMESMGSMGILGNPTMNAFLMASMGKNSLGRNIHTPGASPSQHLQESYWAIHDMLMPGFARSTGTFRNIYNDLSSRGDKDSFGNLKRSLPTDLADISGVAPDSHSVKQGFKNRNLEFQQQLKTLKTFRSKVVHDKSGQYDRALELRGIVEREKLLRAEMREALKNNTTLK
jgi:hypothetical protein